MISYLQPEDLKGVFGVIEQNFARREEVPDYLSVALGMELLLGVLNGVRMDTYYPTLLDKATYLLVQVNSGHFFPNGNKRLALVATGIFLDLNGHAFKNVSKDEYRIFISALFPEFDRYEDFPEFGGVDFGTYNISIIIAESKKLGIAFDSLKERVRRFLEWAMIERVATP